jgi:hypothetical protein
LVTCAEIRARQARRLMDFTEMRQVGLEKALMIAIEGVL